MRKTLTAAITAAALTLPGLQAQAAGEHAMMFWSLEADRFEYRVADGTDAIAWDAEFRYGGDFDKLILETEGEVATDSPLEEAEATLYWSHLLDEFWDGRLGVRQEFRPRPQTTSLVVGVAGMAPLFIETEAYLLVSEGGDISAELTGEFELLLSRRWHLVTEATVTAAASDVPELDIGAGLTGVELSTRLKYQVTRQMEPYLGITWARALGDTANLARAGGEGASDITLSIGTTVKF